MKILAVVLSSLALVACGGGGGGTGARINAVIVSGVASKGPLKNATICAYSVINGTQGAQVGECVTTSADGNYSIDLAGYTGPVFLQASSGTYVDEATGTTVSLSTPLRSVATTLSGSSSMAVTGLTELAYQLASNSSGGLTSANIQSAITSVQNNFGVLDIVGTMPVNALNVPTGASVEQKKYALALATLSQYLAAKPVGAKLSDTIGELQKCIANSATGCSADTSNVGSLLTAAVQKFVAQHDALSGINLPVASFGSVTTPPGNKSVVYKLAATVPSTTCPNGGISVVSGIDTNGNGILDTAEATNTQYVCNGTNGVDGIGGTNGTNGTNGSSALVSIATEPSGSNCATGGSKISAGSDLNGNGKLDSTEVTSTSFICNGANGATGVTGPAGATGVTGAAGAAGATGATGATGPAGATGATGTTGATGATGSAGATGPAGSTGATGPAGTNGLNTLVALAAEPSGTNCASGGTKISAGLDTNADGVLNPSEITSAQYVCNGTIPRNADFTPPQISTDAPAVAVGYITSFTTTYSDDVELAYYVSPSGIVRFVAEGVKSHQVSDSAAVVLGQPYSRVLTVVDTSGNVTKKTISITSQATGIKLGNYLIAGSYSLPAGFNCLIGGNLNGLQDGAVVTGPVTVLDSGPPWSVASGYVPQIVIGGGAGAKAGTSVALESTSITFNAFSSGGSGSGGDWGTYQYQYVATASVLQATAPTLSVTFLMQCNINNTGFVDGTAAIFTVSMAQ